MSDLFMTIKTLMAFALIIFIEVLLILMGEAVLMRVLTVGMG